MAVSLCCRRFQLHVRNRLLQQYRKGYIVLLPELNPNLPDKSPLLKDGMPEFSEITAEKCVNTLGKHLLEFEHQVHLLTTQLNIPDDKEQPTSAFVKKVAEPLEQVAIPLAVTWGIAKTLYLADNKIMPHKCYSPLHTRAYKASCSKYYSPSIYKASEECNVEKLTEEEQRLVEKFRLEGRLNGLNLPENKRDPFEIYRRQISVEKTNFKKRVNIGRDFLATVVHDPRVVQGFPERLLKQIAKDSNEPSRGPWVATVEPHIRNKFLEYCPDKQLRKVLWEKSIKVASSEEDIMTELQNSSCLEKIRELRQSEAECLGFPHYVAVSMETKMAESVENVLGVLEVLRQKARPAHERELEQLREFVVKSGSKDELTLADIPYWQRKHKKVLYNFESEELREYFPLEKVLTGMAELCQRLFDVRFKEVENISTWHPDVKFYNVYEGDGVHPVAGFYLDPYSRPGKMPAEAQSEWVVSIRPAHIVNGAPATPLSAVIMNLPPPLYGKPSLLSFSDVESFFGLFGKLLQHLLSSVTYTAVSGFSNVEWDTVDVSSNFMKHWLYNDKVLRSVSGHYSTGAEIPLKDVHLLPQHMAGTNLCSELYKSTLDLKLYSEKKQYWLTIVKELWPQFFATPLHRLYNEPLSMLDIVSEEWPASYYSHVWSKMIAADIYNAFFEEEADEAAIGARFRGTYLAFGGGCNPHEVFRRFRGRDPSPSAYLRHLGLL